MEGGDLRKGFSFSGIQGQGTEGRKSSGRADKSETVYTLEQRRRANFEEINPSRRSWYLRRNYDAQK